MSTIYNNPNPNADGVGGAQGSQQGQQNGGVGDSSNYPVWPSDWPVDPNEPIPQVPSNPNESIQQQLQDIENYMKWLSQHPNDPQTYNGALAMLHALLVIGQNAKNLSPADLAQFNTIMNSLGNSDIFSGIIRMVMMGAFYQNGANGFSKTNQFIDALAKEFGQLSSVSPFFAGLAATASLEQSFIEQTAEAANSPYIWKDPNTGVTWLTNGQAGASNIMTFQDYQLSAISALSLEIIDSQGNNNASNAVNQYYQSEVNMICTKYKNNPELIVMLLLELMAGGQLNDIGQDVKGEGDQTNNLTAAQKLIASMLALLRGGFQGPNGPQNSQQFIQDLNQLKSMETFFPQLKSAIDGIYNSIMGGTVTVTIGPGNKTVINTLTQNTYFNFPTKAQLGLGPDQGLYYTVNGQTFEVPYGSSMELPAGAQIYIGGTTGQTVSMPLSELCQFKSFTDGNGNTLVVSNGIMDFNDLATYLNSAISNPTNQLLQQIEEGQNLLSSQTPVINQEIQTLTNLQNTLEGMIEKALDSRTQFQTQIVSNMAAANA